MNTQNLVEEKQQKVKFPVGALLLVIIYAINLVRLIITASQTYGSILTAFLPSILYLAVAVILLVKKRGLVPLISLGVFWTFEFIQTVRFSFWGNIFYLLFLATIVLLYLFDFLPIFESKKKIVLIAFYASFAIYGVLFLKDTIAFVIEYGVHNIYSLISGIVSWVAWLLIGLYIINPYQKVREPKEEGTSANAYGASEFYVSLGKHVCLLLFTCGIWMYIWIYKATKFTNLYAGEEERNPVSTLLLCMFVPFYSIYWTYKTALRIDAMAKESGISSDLGTVCLILAIFVGIIPPVLMQEKINTIATKK